MRKYKATVIVIIMVMLIPFMQSCLDDYDDDIYDMQAGMPFNAALATVVTPSEIPGEAMIESDNDGVAYVVNPDKLTYAVADFIDILGNFRLGVTAFFNHSFRE